MTSFCFLSSGCEDAGAFIRRDAAEVVYVLIYYKAFYFSILDADFGRAGGQSEEEVMRELAFELVAPGNVTKGLLRPVPRAKPFPPSTLCSCCTEPASLQYQKSALLFWVAGMFSRRCTPANL